PNLLAYHVQHAPRAPEVFNLRITPDCPRPGGIDAVGSRGSQRNPDVTGLPVTHANNEAHPSPRGHVFVDATDQMTIGSLDLEHKPHPTGVFAPDLRQEAALRGNSRIRLHRDVPADRGDGMGEQRGPNASRS